jgi:GTP-binding protein
MTLISFPAEAVFLRGAMSPKDFPPPTLPELAFAGRSNVGKSSLLNALLHRKKLAHISKKPGKTAQINYFKIGELFLLVDMPGYGYAAVSHKMQALWSALMPAYFKKSQALLETFILIDSRHPPKNTDLQVIEFLESQNRPFTLLLTKIDKTPAVQLAAHQRFLWDFLREDPENPQTLILPVSVKKPESIDQLRTYILSLISQLI